MRRNLLTLALAISGFALWLAGASVAGGITVSEFQKELAAGSKLTVIDVRTTSQYSRGHIPGAINVPASLCAQKNLPPLGRVLVCDAGLGRDAADQAAAALAAKPGITVEILEGGFAAWECAHAATTRAPGMKPEALNYITYEQLKAAKAGDLVLVDLRHPASPKQDPTAANAAAQAPEPLTDLSREFPGLPLTQSPFAAQPNLKAAGAGSATPPLLVLIDNGDGKAQELARTLKANSVKRYAILAGGELILSRHGQRGLQRSGPSWQPPGPSSAAKAAAN
jgi:rhodanese-related sulfurtransferase